MNAKTEPPAVSSAGDIPPALSATQLCAAYAARRLSPVEVTKAAFERIARWEPALNAMFLLSKDAALAQAKASEERWRAGTPVSALDGVPVTIKENIYTRGDPAPIGTAANQGLAPADADAPPAARVREAGCVILGKTTTQSMSCERIPTVC